MSRNGRKYYYDDKRHHQFVVQIKDVYFTGKMIKKGFCYKDDYIFTREEAEKNAKSLAEYLYSYRELKIGPLNQDNL